MGRKGMFSFTREENDPQTGRKKNNTELDEKGTRSVLSAKPKWWISVAEEHFLFDLIQKENE